MFGGWRKNPSVPVVATQYEKVYETAVQANPEVMY